MSRLIPHNRPCILPEDRAATDAVLASGWIAQGPAVAALEQQFVRLYGGGAACALSSGTAALFVALKALGAHRGSAVVVPTYACSALLNAVLMNGSEARVVDVNPDTFCIDAAQVAERAGDARFVIAVHTFGAPADVQALDADRRVVIEDCCHCLGGVAGDGPLGRAGAAAIFSFYATKIITGGQGGLIWSGNEATTEKARDYRQFDGREAYVPRFNLQMTDMQAALAGAQYARLEAIRARRAEIAGRYRSALPNGLGVHWGVTSAGRMAYRFVVLAPDLRVREALRAHMEGAGVGCIVPIERFELLHRYLKLDPAQFPVSERLADTTLSLPMHLGVSGADLDTVCEALGSFRP